MKDGCSPSSDKGAGGEHLRRPELNISTNSSERTDVTSNVSGSATLGTRRQDSCADMVCRFVSLEWAVRPYLKRRDSPEEVRKTSLWVKSTLVVWMLSGTCFFASLFWKSRAHSTADDESVSSFLLARQALLGSLCLVLSLALLWSYRRWNDTTCKVVCGSMLFLWILAASLISKEVPAHMGIILVLDQLVVLRNERDSQLLQRLCTVMLVLYAALMAASTYSEKKFREDGEWSIHIFHEEEQAVQYSWLMVWVANVIPVVLNFGLVQGYASAAEKEAHASKHATELASKLAYRLANYDLKGAEELLLEARSRNVNRAVTRPFRHLLRNLRAYRAFLPDALFLQTVTIEDANAGNSCPNETLATAMKGQETKWDTAKSCVQRLRDPSYTLASFQDDVQTAFPELNLYALSGGNSTGRCTSGRANIEEMERTMGALYSVFCISRIDMDGKEVFAFGVDEQGRPRPMPAADGPEAKKVIFYEGMDWSSMWELFLRADLVREEDDGHVEVNQERMLGFLVLTVIHDIMKNPDLLPTVQPQHSPYGNSYEGDVISDHDSALAYVMEKFPWMLPSYRELRPAQRAPILFTQGTMNFNNGWLVQGEAPPGILFSTFKQVIQQGRASEADVAFYFAHWLTDLAGAEPYMQQPWPGAEKFTTKFPLRVLMAFLDSFSFVDRLAVCSEVEVFESYLNSRWTSFFLDQPSPTLKPGMEIAAMRIALMAQGFEKEAIQAFAELQPSEREVLEVELARTACRHQFQKCPPALMGPPMGPAILIYYSPALLQKAGSKDITGALLLMAAVFRAAREMFPLEHSSAFATAVVRIDQLKVFAPTDAWESGPWHLQRTARNDCKAGRDADLSEDEALPATPRGPGPARQLTVGSQAHSEVSGLRSGPSHAMVDRLPINMSKVVEWVASQGVDFAGL